MLNDKDFKKLVSISPLFSIDLVVVNSEYEILVGERKNAPAKGFWFVPGGRVFKNEPLDKAFTRICSNELGIEFSRNESSLLGLFEHFYDDSFFDSEIKTHYINAAHVIKLKSEQLNLPEEQHSQYRWLSLEELQHDEQVHHYSKIFLPTLKTVVTT